MITSKSATGPGNSNVSPALRAPRRVAPKTKRPSNSKPVGKPKQSGRPQSKQDHVLAMLRQKDGTTIPAVMKATGWQQHSVHGFLSGVIRKKLKLRLVSTKVDDKCIYRIVDKSPTKTGGRQASRHSA